MTQNQFSQETIKQAVYVIKSHEADIISMKEMCVNMPSLEVAQTILMDKFGITQIEAEEIIEDINRGITEFDRQFHENTISGKIVARQKLEELTKDMSNEERVNRYANILTTLQLLERGEDIQHEEVEQLLVTNGQKDADTLAEEIESLLNDGINLEGLSNAVKNGVSTQTVAEFAKQIEMNKEDYRLMAALWLYIAQREGSMRLTESEVPVPAQVLGSLSSASVEAILATAELEENNIDLKRWQVVMKWILGAVFVAGLLYLLWNVLAALALLTTILVLDVFASSVIGAIISVLTCYMLFFFFVAKTFEYGSISLDFLSEIYDDYIGPLTEKTKALTEKIKEWLKRVVSVITNSGGGSSGGPDDRYPSSQTETVINSGEEYGIQPVMA